LQRLIENLAKQVCEDLDFYLVEVRIRGDKRQPIFEIYADTEDGITLSECEKLTRELQDRLDIQEEFSGNYRLNVSSPGVDRPLQRDYEFKKNIGQNVVVKLKSDDTIIKRTGQLSGYDENVLILDISGKEEIIDRSEIDEVKVKTKW